MYTLIRYDHLLLPDTMVITISIIVCIPFQIMTLQQKRKSVNKGPATRQFYSLRLQNFISAKTSQRFNAILEHVFSVPFVCGIVSIMLAFCYKNTQLKEYLLNISLKI